MEYIFHFLLAHFLADYPFQWGALVKLKNKRYLGVFIHSTIHLFFMLLILAPLLHEIEVQISIAAIYVTHNLIDQAKVRLDKKDPKRHRMYYFLDQLSHWSIIVSLVWYMAPVTPNLEGQWLDLYTNKVLWFYLLSMVVMTYFYDVSRYFVTLKSTKLDYKRDHRLILQNAVLVTLAFVIVGYLV